MHVCRREGARRAASAGFPPSDGAAPVGRGLGELSRGVRQRVQRRVAAHRRVEECAWALNVLGGQEKVGRIGPVSEAEGCAVRHIEGCVGSFPWSAEIDSQEALRQLLREDARYCEGGGEGVGDIAPFGSAAISLPSVPLSSPDVRELLGGDAVWYEGEGRRMLRTADERRAHNA